MQNTTKKQKDAQAAFSKAAKKPGGVKKGSKIVKKGK